MQTQIRLPLKKQSDQDLPCLLFWHTFYEFQYWKATFYLRTGKKSVWDCNTEKEHTVIQKKMCNMRFPTMWLCDQQRLRPACTYAQSDQSLCLSLEYSMILRLLTEYHLEFLSLKGSCTGWSESALVKMPRYWKSHVTAQMSYSILSV